MRCFLALEPPEAVSARLGALQAEAREIGLDAGFPKETHLTLCFYGEITESEAQAKISALRNAGLKKTRVEIAGTGFFPDVLRPRVFWAGAGGVGLLELQAQAAKATNYKEARAFSPHITLARIKSGRGVPQLRALQKKHALDVFGSFECATLAFKKSGLSPEGAVHSTLAEIQLL